MMTKAHKGVVCEYRDKICLRSYEHVQRKWCDTFHKHKKLLGPDVRVLSLEICLLLKRIENEPTLTRNTKSAFAIGK